VQRPPHTFVSSEGTGRAASEEPLDILPLRLQSFQRRTARFTMKLSPQPLLTPFVAFSETTLSTTPFKLFCPGVRRTRYLIPHTTRDTPREPNQNKKDDFHVNTWGKAFFLFGERGGDVQRVGDQIEARHVPERGMRQTFVGNAVLRPNHTGASTSLNVRPPFGVRTPARRSALRRERAVHTSRCRGSIRGDAPSGVLAGCRRCPSRASRQLRA